MTVIETEWYAPLVSSLYYIYNNSRDIFYLVEIFYIIT